LFVEKMPLLTYRPPDADADQATLAVDPPKGEE